MSTVLTTHEAFQMQFLMIYLFCILSQVAKSYVLATSGALVTALSLNKLVKVSKHFILNFLIVKRKLFF